MLVILLMLTLLLKLSTWQWAQPLTEVERSITSVKANDEGQVEGSENNSLSSKSRLRFAD